MTNPELVDPEPNYLTLRDVVDPFHVKRWTTRSLLFQSATLIHRRRRC